MDGTNYMEMNDDLLITYLLGEASAEEVAEVDKWLALDIANQQRLQQFRTIWETSKTMQFTEPLDAQASLYALKQKIAARPKVVRIQRNFTWLKVAATLLLICGGAWLYFARIFNKEILTASVNEVKVDTLSDGSVITLNRHSILQYPQRFNGNQRVVSLKEGEAFFKISPNKAKPFIINTSGTVIKVVGTSFNVKNKHGRVEVIVETGIVQVSNREGSVTLTPGDKVLVGDNSNLVKEQNPDKLYTYYRSKEFVADNTPLWRMVEVLNEAYDSHIIIGRKELNNQLLNTTFKNESLDDILQVISRTFKITVETNGKQIILK
ncbi:FecR domain-containing protein [Mucilaginibacter jinjuensis]|uniref:FecR domain-containing protein n=1 Tax=Mucilaginibacter jinjuensis TaxID=1176721 RepID=A0ABY7TF20_9SPHI|nr:FecR domain-containing protein [Mucilaginibacter jinjuensis]WCT14839.1 FecR domain-containing protein [Mucilaginibacter jinjuensis]